MGRRKQAKRVEAEAILEGMPLEPDRIAQDVIYSDDMIDSIGASLLIVERIPRTEYRGQLKQMMSYEDWEAYEGSAVSFWGARMTCTFCGTGFDGIWVKPKGMSACFVLDDQNEHLFGGVGFGIDGWEERPDGRLQIPTEDAEGSCPCCGRYGRTHRKSWLGKKGKTFRQIFTTAEAWNGYAGIFHWMAELHVDAYALSTMELLPRDALVAGKDGTLYAFSCVSGAWERIPVEEKLLGHRPYRSALPGHGEQRAATWQTWVCGCDTDGSSMEKTGIDRLFIQEDYLTDDPNLAEEYLRFWEKHRGIENLMRQGWDAAALEAVEGKLEGLDWSRQKPHEILGLTKEEYRQAKPLSAEQLLQYKLFKINWPKQACMETFTRLQNRYADRLGLLLDRAEPEPEWNPCRVDRYLERQGLANRTGLMLLEDYRTGAAMLNALHTNRDWWPKQLQRKHDETAAAGNFKGAACAMRFQALQSWLEGTAWSDGAFCIRPAASPAELTEEGRVLKHCVGGYAEKMAARTDVIFFIRKARRPERSWLTLDVCMTGDKPYMVQLHGYGNEHNWETKCTWEVPKKGRDFVNRWMTEVLQPWWDRKKGKAETKRRKTA